MTANSKTSAAQAVNLGRVWWVGLAAVALAALVNGLVRTLARALLTVDPGFEPLVTPAFLPLTIIGGGAVALVLSLVPDLGLLGRMPGATPATVGVLMLMHVLTAGIVVGGLTTFMRQQ